MAQPVRCFRRGVIVFESIFSTINLPVPTDIYHIAIKKPLLVFQERSFDLLLISFKRADQRKSIYNKR